MLHVFVILLNLIPPAKKAEAYMQNLGIKVIKLCLFVTGIKAITVIKLRLFVSCIVKAYFTTECTKTVGFQGSRSARDFVFGRALNFRLKNRVHIIF